MTSEAGGSGGRGRTPTGPGSRVLVVEDEYSIAEFLRVGLSYEGFEVETAQDGRRGLRLAIEGD
ncbi:hypothetical protein [Rubrobacter indicoceani]|uniref:hypothetical protein n=1 Tax=Rubrobacter indicoceani TaxID=2051957 RepID=UPI0023E0DB20|nr:hypothetical protein [Rubrobacter indicoceani]